MKSAGFCRSSKVPEIEDHLLYSSGFKYNINDTGQKLFLSFKEYPSWMSFTHMSQKVPDSQTLALQTPQTQVDLKLQGSIVGKGSWKELVCLPDVETEAKITRPGD